MKVSLMGLGDQVRDPVTGNREDAAQRHRAMVEAAVVADETGYHSVHIGEHHGQAAFVDMTELIGTQVIPQLA